MIAQLDALNAHFRCHEEQLHLTLPVWSIGDTNSFILAERPPGQEMRHRWNNIIRVHFQPFTAIIFSEYGGELLDPHDLQQFTATKHLTIDHVHNLQLPVVQFIRAGGATVLDHDHIETLIGQTAHRG